MRQENFSHWAVYSLTIFVLKEHQTFDLFGLEPMAIGCRLSVQTTEPYSSLTSVPSSRSHWGIELLRKSMICKLHCVSSSLA